MAVHAIEDVESAGYAVQHEDIVDVVGTAAGVGVGADVVVVVYVDVDVGVGVAAGVGEVADESVGAAVESCFVVLVYNNYGEHDRDGALENALEQLA